MTPEQLRRARIAVYAPLSLGAAEIADAREDGAWLYVAGAPIRNGTQECWDLRGARALLIDPAGRPLTDEVPLEPIEVPPGRSLLVAVALRLTPGGAAVNLNEEEESADA